MKKLMAVICIAALLGSLAGCSGTQAPGSTADVSSPGTESSQTSGAGSEKASYEGMEIRVLCVTGQFTPNLEEHLPEFQEQTGINVNLEQYAEAQLHQKCVTEFLAGNSTADALTLNPTTNLLAYTKNNWLEPLDSYVSDPEKTGDWDWADFTPGTFPRCYYKDTLYAIPVLGGRSAMFYRTDILEEHGLEPPKTYDELLAVCQKVTDPDKNIYGIGMRGEKSALTSQLSRFIYSFGSSFIDEGVCQFDTPESVEAVRFYGNLLGNYAPPGILSCGYNQMAQLFNTGQVVLLIEAAVLLPSITDPAESQYADCVGVAPVPAGPDGIQEANMNTWSAAVYSGSKNKDAAWEFVKFATSKENISQNMLNGLLGYRQSVLEDKEIQEQVFPNLLNVYKIYNEDKTARNIDGLPIMTSVTEARDVMGEAVVYSIETKGEGPELEAKMKDATQKVNELLKADGEYGKDYPFGLD